MKKLIVLMAAMMTFASTSFAQLGSAASDLVYTPITPCRVLDTRSGGGAIAAGSTRNFQIWGAATYAAQGGTASNCGITAGADVAAVAMNVTVVTPAAGGFVTAYPFGALLPLAATVNFQAGDIARGDFTIAKVTQTGTSHLSIFSSSNADVVGDVVGFYSKPVATALTCNTNTATRALAIGFDGWNYATASCPAGTRATAPYCFRSAANVYLTGSGTSGSQPWCAWANQSGAAQTVSEGANCCNIPGR